MKYQVLAGKLSKIEVTSKRTEMTNHLVELFKATPPDHIRDVIGLIRGSPYPDYEDFQYGMAEKMVIKSIANATGLTTNQIVEKMKEKGDLGKAAEEELAIKKQTTLFTKLLDVKYMSETLDKIGRTSGKGSVDTKIKLLAGLLTNASPLEARYIIRTILGQMRLGMADMTIMDALAIAYTDNATNRPIIERAFNISSDLGLIAERLVKEGIESVKDFKVTIRHPIRMMMAQRSGEKEEIFAKLKGTFIAEFKYDGERLQIHKDGETVLIFSRRLEEISEQYPDVCEMVRAQIRANNAIIEGEVVAYNVETGELRPFQELMHRRRKYGIKKTMKAIPVNLFLFDLLYLDNKDFTNKNYPLRRKALEKIVNETEQLRLAVQKEITSEDELEEFFESAVEKGCEGIMAKSIQEESIYQAGARGWLWIKFKRDYKSEVADTIDAVVIGAYVGYGARTGFYGSLLMACYDPIENQFKSVCRMGSGFTDEHLETLQKLLDQYRVSKKPPRVIIKNSTVPDIWIKPTIVLEVQAAELTLSPVHTCALDMIRKGSGLAMRFPRFTGRIRDDKTAEQATSQQEIIDLFKGQLKKIE
ncbi:ATP-dependent DNA ligase [Candidatus Borrarchaeum sp.]|uniref:ATP-dependent DNA ligase n=1 Tax=Candidatus Borrarchaeum sp. TaxID=2846742 RepID=UPI00257CB775|nr:ATP-dependent DNA ligase [Candidatus Borrarchaeum sp.]